MGLFSIDKYSLKKKFTWFKNFSYFFPIIIVFFNIIITIIHNNKIIYSTVNLYDYIPTSTSELKYKFLSLFSLSEIQSRKYERQKFDNPIH